MNKSQAQGGHSNGGFGLLKNIYRAVKIYKYVQSGFILQIQLIQT